MALSPRLLVELLATSVNLQGSIPQEEGPDGIHYSPQDAVDLQAAINESVVEAVKALLKSHEELEARVRHLEAH